MKKFFCTAIAAAGLLFTFSLPVYAWHGGHFSESIWVGPAWGPVYPYPYYAGPPAIAQQPVIVEQPPAEYVQQAPQSDEPSYWYYCPDPKGYYPYVKRCPQGWMKVAPTPAPAGGDEPDGEE